MSERAGQFYQLTAISEESCGSIEENVKEAH
jgi:hypothetical protein